MSFQLNTNYLSIEDFKSKSKSEIPKFDFEYIGGARNDTINAYRIMTEQPKIQLLPEYLKIIVVSF